MNNHNLIKPKQTQTTQAWLKTVILLGLSIYFAYLGLSGNLANYINLRFAWMSWMALAIFALLGLWSLRNLLQQTQNLVFTSHVPLSSGAILILGIPLLMAAFLPSQPLTSDAITGGISFQAVGGVSATARFDIPPLERNVLDWLREFDRTSNPAELDALPVDIIAFVYREPNMSPTQFMAARFTLSCCVADAFAIGLPVEYADAESLTDGAWVRIQGTLQAGDFQGEFMPIIQPTSIEAVDAPQNPYLYS